MILWNPARAQDPNVPWWCGLSDWLDLKAEPCRPLTPDQIRERQRAEFGPALTEESREAALTTGDVAVARYCDLHPIECAEYTRVVREQEETPWYVWAAVAIGGLLLVRAVQ